MKYNILGEDPLRKHLTVRKNDPKITIRQTRSTKIQLKQTKQEIETNDQEFASNFLDENPKRKRDENPLDVSIKSTVAKRKKKDLVQMTRKYL